MKDKRTGLKPKERKLATTTKKNKLTANQWQNTPQQNQFLEYYLDIDSDSFGNAYRSALKANYKPGYAVKITAPTNITKWLSEYRKRNDYTEEHIKQLLQALANDPKHFNNSKSPADTRIKSLEVLSKILGLTDNRHNNVTVNVVQPILGGKSTDTNRVIIDQ